MNATDSADATDRVALMIDNHRNASEAAIDQAQLELDTAKDAEQVRDGIWTTEEAQRFLLADALKDWIEDEIDDMPVANFRDALRAELARFAFERVDWHELADHYLTKVREGAKGGAA